MPAGRKPAMGLEFFKSLKSSYNQESLQRLAKKDKKPGLLTQKLL